MASRQGMRGTARGSDHQHGTRPARGRRPVRRRREPVLGHSRLRVVRPSPRWREMRRVDPAGKAEVERPEVRHGFIVDERDSGPEG